MSALCPMISPGWSEMMVWRHRRHVVDANRDGEASTRFVSRTKSCVFTDTDCAWMTVCSVSRRRWLVALSLFM